MIDLRTTIATELLRCKSIGGQRFWNPVLLLYAIAIDPRNLNVFAVVGSNQGNSVYLFTRDMGLGNNPVPSSQSSTCSEANGKATPQVYKGHGKKRMWMV
ncbi:hypothetical protein V6N13_063835 [Hibiscus sabdariffa]